jgi:pyruvate dehydrogenase E1 component
VKQTRDVDPIETKEWVQSFEEVVQQQGRKRGSFLLSALLEEGRKLQAIPNGPLVTDYVNTIPVNEEPAFPGDEDLEVRLRRIIRWNAMVMVHRANTRFEGLGGHLSSYASASLLYEVGFNHFFRGRGGDRSGDQIYFQGHAAPGIYARSFLEGFLSEDRLDHFRREAPPKLGLSSYPHPRLMPDYWEFPTVSMGLGPISAIYQARFNRYLHARGLADTSKARVWAFLGDGETDEPESLGAISVAGREGLDNLTFVVNCNLQRLDGPVRGNGKIVQELEAVFRGVGWNVIKVLWGRGWDPLLAKDETGALRRVFNELKDGHWQKFATLSGAEIRKELFGLDPALANLVSDHSDTQLEQLRRGGHDSKKLFAAYQKACTPNGAPTVILAHTVKGWSLGDGFEAKNVTHSMKKMKLKELQLFRDRLQLPIPDSKLENPPFYHPGEKSVEIQYLKERRAALGGHIPCRTKTVVSKPKLPEAELYGEFLEGTTSGDGVSTTIAFVRLLMKLVRDKDLGKFIVPIIPDEARTFGMDPFFRMVGIYATHGQLYEPVDAGLLLYYREAADGQVLEEGITEAGAMASFTAAGTSYATHGVQTIPFYTFYSMFGFQRIGDQAWAFGDLRGRGFLLGATAGRTTLAGEGLQHCDGHSHVLASTIPNIQAYDPAFAYEIALIIQEGLRRMVEKEEDIYYYLTLQNENYPMPKMPKGVEEGILQGIYPYRLAPKKRDHHIQLFGSGSIMNEVRRASRILEKDFGISSDLWSITSYQSLRRNALACEHWNRFHPEEPRRIPYISTALKGTEGPFIAATDFMKIVPEMVSRWIPGSFHVLGTDGFGLSDTRENLRRHFEVDAENIALTSLEALVQEGKIPPERLSEALSILGLDPSKVDPMDL